MGININLKLSGRGSKTPRSARNPRRNGHLRTGLVLAMLGALLQETTCGRPRDHRRAERHPDGRADRHQPVLRPLPDARELGLQAARQEEARGVDRGDEARRQDDRAHPLPRRRPQPAASRARCRSARSRSRCTSSTSTLEREAVARLNKAIALCLTKSDAGTRELLEHLLSDEEDSVDWLEAQLDDRQGHRPRALPRGAAQGVALDGRASTPSTAPMSSMSRPPRSSSSRRPRAHSASTSSSL